MVGADGLPDDPVAEAGREPLDLGDDRLGGVAGVAVRARGRRSTAGGCRRPSAPGRRGTAGRRARTAARACARRGCRARWRRSRRSCRRGAPCPARRASGLVHGTPPSTAKSTLNAPGPVAVPAVGARDPAPAAGRRGCRRPRRGPGRAWRRRPAAVVTPPRPWTPVSILPPRSASSAASASVIDRDPPSATGHPWRWPAARMPMPDRRGHRVVQGPEGVRGDPAEQGPRLVGVRTTWPRWMRAARWAHRTGPASAGGAGTRSSGPMMSSARSSKLADGHPNSPRQRDPSAPRPAAVWLDGAVQHARRCRRRAGGRSRSRATASAARSAPGRGRSENGEPTAIGWIAEQWSCSRPGTISSLVRVPPPISSAASSTVTCDAGLARAIGGGQPVGPAADDDRGAHVSAP